MEHAADMYNSQSTGRRPRWRRGLLLAALAALLLAASAVTATVAAQVTQLRAEALNVPGDHDGSTTFTFELRFSEEFSISYKTLRDHAFNVTGGEVVKAKRLEPPSNVRWTISVTPDGNGPVTVVLPPTTDCTAQGAVCTQDGRMLSNRLEVEVPGPNSSATGAPAITGTAQVGETLTADTSGIADADGIDNVTFEYQWIATDADEDTAIDNATDSAYTLAAADEGKTIKVRVSFTDDAGNDETLTSAATAAVAARPNSSATGAPAITGTAQVGETLTADTSGIADADGIDNVTFEYQWIATDADEDTAIDNATDSAYTLAAADEGKTIKVRVSFTDDAGNDETLTSASTAAVAARPNSPATGAPAITGTAQVGETLTADTSGIADADGIDNVTFEYQWIATDGDGDTAITNATGSAYTLAAADEGKTIKVRVSFTDDAGNDETLTSAATAEVTADDQSLARPTGLTATVVNGNVVLTWDDPDDDRITGYAILGGLHETLITNLYNLYAANGSPAFTYTDDRAQAGVPNYYAVRPIAGDEATERSELVSVTPPAQPSRFMSPTVGEASITLAWEAPAGLSWDHYAEHHVGTGTTGYQVLRGDSLDSLAVLVQDTGNTDTTYADDYTLGDGVVYYGLRTLSADGSSTLAVQWAGTPPPDPNKHGERWETLVSNLNAGSGTTTTISAGGGALSQPFITGPSEEGYELNTVRLRIRPASKTTEVAVSVHADQGGSYGSRLFKLSSPDTLDGEFDDFTAPQGSMLEAGTTYWIVIRAVSGSAVLELSTGTGTDDESMTGFALPAHSSPGNSGGSGRTSGNGNSTRSAPNSVKGGGDALQPRQQPNALRSKLQGRDARDVSNVNAQAPTLALGETVRSTIDSPDDYDRFRVSLETGVMYLVSAHRDGYLRLDLDVYDMDDARQPTYDTNYTCIFGFIDQGLSFSERTESELFFTPTATADYFIQVGSYHDDTGSDYSLIVTEADPEAADTSTTAEATPGVSFSGRLHVPYDADYDCNYQDTDTPGSAVERANAARYNPDTHDVDWVRLPGLQAGTTYTIILRGTPYALNLRVTGMYDSAGTRLSGFGEINSVREGYNAAKLRIFFTPETSGDHYIGITARAAGSATRCTYRSHGLSYTLELWEPADAPLAITAPPLTAVTDGSTYPELNGARGIATHTIGNSHYAIATGFDDDGFQIIDVTDPSNPTAVADETDGRNGFTALEEASWVATHTIGSSHYAIITAAEDDGVQIVDITNPASPTAVDAIFDGDADANGNTFAGLGGASGIAVHTIGNRHYALVAAFLDDGVQIIDITDPASPTAVAAIFDGGADANGNTFAELGGASGIAVHTIGNRHYALVAASFDDGVQIMDITVPANPIAVSHMTDGQGGFDELEGALAVATHTIGGRHYALVAAISDDGVQIIDFTDPTNPTPAAGVTDGQDGFDRLDGAWDITTVTIRHRHYALVASRFDDGVHIIDFTDPRNPQLVMALVDGQGGFTTLDGATGIAVHTIGSRHYALVTAEVDDGVQIFELAPNDGFATRFTTGKGESGQPYIPTSVELEFLSPSTNFRPVVSLHADDNGQPGWKIATLEQVGDVTADVASVVKFTIPEGYQGPTYGPDEVSLTANRVFWIVVELDVRGSVYLAPDGDESSGLPYDSVGWEIGNDLYLNSSGSWSVLRSNQPLYFRIKGYERVNPTFDR